MRDLEPDDVYRRLSRPVAADPRGLSRRRFLQLAAGGAGALAVPAWLDTVAAAAAPLKATDQILVTILLKGGNDGLNTVVPTSDSAYYAKRRTLAIPAAAALPIGGGFALHPALTKTHARFKAGNVAVVRGVGSPKPDLSHFESMASVMRGWGGPGTAATGWLGRWLDGAAGPDQLTAVTIGSAVPLHLVGRSRQAASLSPSSPGALGKQSDPTDARLLDAVRSLAAKPTGLGQWGDRLAQSGRDAVDLAAKVAPSYAPELPKDKLTRAFTLGARLINADIGVRVLDGAFGDFDNHADQPAAHAANLAQLDAAVDAFFAALSPSFAGRVTVMTFSEFGRRPEANSSSGTDHGTASSVLVMGPNVKGGLYGAQPSLTSLDRHGNLAAIVDHRSVYATVLESVLRADSRAVLGATYENLRFIAP